MALKYKDGNSIEVGDKVLLHGEPATIEEVIEERTGDLTRDWYLTENGPGVLVLEPKQFGRVFLRDLGKAEDLVFVERKRRQSE